MAAFGLVINRISMRMLSSGKDASLNLNGAYLEASSDMPGSMGVILGALVTQSTDWRWVDSCRACTSCASGRCPVEFDGTRHPRARTRISDGIAPGVAGGADHAVQGVPHEAALETTCCQLAVDGCNGVEREQATDRDPKPIDKGHGHRPQGRHFVIA